MQNLYGAAKERTGEAITISSTSSSITVAGDGLNQSFSFPFVADSAADILVQYVAADGTITDLNSTQYTLTINPAGPNQLWGVGGTITYPLVGSPIAAGTYLSIQRILPFTQEVTVRNQGNYYAQVTEQALDELEMQIQQVNSAVGRSVQFPASDPSDVSPILPSFIERANQYLGFDADGNAIALPGTGNTVTVTPAQGGGTGQSSYNIGDILYASAATTLSKLAAVAVGKALISSGVATAPAWGVPYGALLNVRVFTVSGTYTPTSGCRASLILCQGAGGGGGGSGTGAPTAGGAGGTCSVGTLASCTGGAGGSASLTSLVGGDGGVGSLGLLNIAGGGGAGGQSAANSTGGGGGSSFFSGGSRGGGVSGAGTTAGANTGAGAGGGGGGAAITSGGGGGAGGFSLAYTTGITGTYTVTIGAGGTAGGAGTSGFAGGAGGSGVAVILEFA